MPSLLDEQDSHFLIELGLCFLAVWTLLEIGFLILVVFVLAPKLHEPASNPPEYPCDHKEFILRIFDAVDNLDSYTFEKYVSGFFLGADFNEIHSENVCSWLAWAMFNKSLKDLTKQEHFVLYDTFEESCRRHPELARMPKGFNPNLKHVCMCLERIPYFHRPLFMYVMVSLFEFSMNSLFLRAGGFQRLNIHGTKYWYRGSNSEVDRGADPVLFLHGISSGWSFYMSMVRALGRDRAIILVDLDAIKVKSLRFSMPSPQQFADAVRLILRRHRIPRVSVVGHSFGSVSANWFVSRYPQLVSHLTLIDPVSMLLAFPDVAYSFIYRIPQNFSQWIIFFAASREITVSHMLHRQFWWYQNILWLEDIPDHIGVVVGLAAEDQITAPGVLREYVQRCQERRMLKAAGAHDALLAPTRSPTGSPAAGERSRAHTNSSCDELDLCNSAPGVSCVVELPPTAATSSATSIASSSKIAQYYQNISLRQRSQSGRTSPKLGSTAARMRRSKSSRGNLCDAGSSAGISSSSATSAPSYTSLSRCSSFAHLSASAAASPSSPPSRCPSRCSLNDMDSVYSDTNSTGDDLSLATSGASAGAGAAPEQLMSPGRASRAGCAFLPPARVSNTGIPGVWEDTCSAINETVAASGFTAANLVVLDKNGESSVSAGGAASALEKEPRQSRMALIECVIWDEFQHGQILLPGLVQDHFLGKMYRNEKTAALSVQPTATSAAGCVKSGSTV